MARGRILSKSISHSVKISRLYKLNKELAELAVILFSWSIAHSDDYGQLSADPDSLKLEVLSNSPRNVEEIKESLFMLYHVNLIKLGVCEDEPILKIVNFEKYQTFRSDRKKINKYYDTKWDTNDIPKTYQWQTLVFSKLSEVKLSEVKRIEEKERKEKKEKTNYFEKFFNLYPKKENKEESKKTWNDLFVLGVNEKEFLFPITNDTFLFLIKALKNQIKEKEIKLNNNKFVSEWPFLSNWLKKKRWEDEVDLTDSTEAEQLPGCTSQVPPGA